MNFRETWKKAKTDVVLSLMLCCTGKSSMFLGTQRTSLSRYEIFELGPECASISTSGVPSRHGEARLSELLQRSQSTLDRNTLFVHQKK